MPSPLPYELVLSIRLVTWRDLFAAYGHPPALPATALRTAPLPSVADALSASDLPLPLVRALHTIAAFATEAGRADLYAAADALGFPTRWPDATSPADLIALLLAAAATDDALRELLDAAQILRDRDFRPRTTLVYVGASAVDANVGEPTQYQAPWERELSAWCARRDFGAVVAVHARAHAGVLSFELIHEDRAIAHVAATPSRPGAAPAPSVSSQRSLRSHLVTYEPATRRLSITTDSLEAATPLASMAGVVFFGAERHFLEEQALDLWKLQELGADALTVPALAGKLTVSAIGGTWHSGKSHAMTPRGRDFFEALSRYKIRIEGGRLDLMTLRARRVEKGDGPAQADVAIRPPHLLTVSEPELAPLLREFLDRAQITRPAARVRDFFSLQPWIEPAATWTAIEGEAGFGDLVTRGLLVADTANRAVAPPAHPHAGRTATAYPLRGDRFLAWSPDRSIAPFVVRERDLVVYVLSFAKLASTVADALSLEGAATALDDDGVLACGRRALGPTHVAIFLLTRPIRPATVERLREAADHGHAILIVPEARIEKHGLRQIAMPKLAADWRPLLGHVVRALKLESFVETTLYAPADARVVLHRATGRVWIDGVLCASLTDTHFKLLEILITQAGQVHTKEIAEHISRGHKHDDTTRKAIDTLVAAVTKSFRAQKKKPPKDLGAFITRTRHGSYALNVKGFVE
jgi:hypothetical protein